MVIYLLYCADNNNNNNNKDVVKDDHDGETEKIGNNKEECLVKYWFFTCTSDDNNYIHNAKVAVLSSQKVTTLKPVCMYMQLGSENSNTFQTWLIEHGVIVVNVSVSKYDILTKIAAIKSIVGDDTLGISSWIRVIIPDIVQELKNSSPLQVDSSLDYILYTDADVIFHRKFNIISKPRYLSFAIQGDKYCCGTNKYDHLSHINAGIFVMNVSGYRESMTDFFKFILSKNKVSMGFNDQAAFKDFYPQESMYQLYHSSIVGRVSLYIFQKKIYTLLSMTQNHYYSNTLPKYVNWEPYLGMNKDAIIFHFHGFKLIFDINNCKNTSSNSSSVDFILRSSYENQNQKHNKISKLLGNVSEDGYRYSAELFHSYQKLICK